MRDHRAAAPWICVLACLWLASTGVAASGYDQAVAAFRAGDYEAAATAFDALVEDRPDWAAGWVALGQCYYMLDRPDEAVASIERARETDTGTDLFAAFNGAGQLLLRQQRYDRAVDPLTHALEHAPETLRPATALRLAFSQLRARQYDAARATLKRHEETAGRSRESAYYLALACQGLDDYDGALNALRAARALGDDDGELSAQLGKWSHYWALLPGNEARREELLAGAAKDTGAWLQARPGDPEALRAYADALLAAGRTRELIERLSPLAAHEPRNCRILLYTAKAFNAEENAVEAERWAREATACDAALADGWVELAAASIRQVSPEYSSADEVRRDRQRLERAVSALERAIEQDPERAGRARAMLADARRTLERRVQAEEEFVRNDLEYIQSVEKAKLREIRRTCEGILWKREGDQALTPEEETYFTEHDCRRFARTGG